MNKNTSIVKIACQAIKSIVYWYNFTHSDSLHQTEDHLWSKYKADDGKTYVVFRETMSDKEYYEKEVTIVIGFRLRFIKSNPFCHFLFQKLCVLDTPVWVGFPGFKKKFWLVALETKDYLGIYRYQGRENAQHYVEYITAVLKPLSVKGSVWSAIMDTNFDQYVEKRLAV